MTTHDHATFIEGCFRCELSRGEAHALPPDTTEATAPESEK